METAAQTKSRYRDTPTRLIRTVARPEPDLWDDDLHVARPRRAATPLSLIARFAHVLVPAALTALVGALGLGRPSLWTDELATWGMATTPWSEFWPVLRWVDAVLAPYYVFMHLWVDVFGDSDVSLRMPSLLAMVGSAGLIGAIGHRLRGRPSTGMLAGVVFALLASTSRFAAEARPYALAVLVACVATWLLLEAWRRPTVWRFAAYGLAIAALGWLQLVALLLVAGHAWTTLAWRRDVWWRFTAAAGVGGLASVVMLVYGYRQRNQVAYIDPVSIATLHDYTEVLFGGAAVAVAFVLIGLFSLPLRRGASLFTAWAVVPTAALLLVSAVLPMFLPRYLLVTMPGWSLAIGAALARIRPAVALAAVVALAGLAGPAQVQVRAFDGHGQNGREVALLVGTGVQAGDGIVYADSESVGDWTARDAIAHYLPPAYRPQDLLATALPRRNGSLQATECVDVAVCIGVRDRLWVVRAATIADPLSGLGSAKEDFLRDRYEVVALWHPTGFTVALLERIDKES